MTPLFDPMKQCHGKVPYPSKREAKRATHRLKDRTLYAYRCPWCRLFHLGHRYKGVA